MFDTFTSSVRSSWATVAGRKRRSASLSDDSDLSRTSEWKGETDSIRRVVDEPRQQMQHEADCECGVEAETWKKRAEKAEQRLRLLEQEANRRLVAQQVEFEQRVQRQEAEAEDRANLLLAAPGLEQDLRHTKKELQKTVALLETRSAELRDAQAYLTRLDDVADAEVLQLVGGINSRIYQAAASIADAFESRYGELKDGRVSQEAARRLEYLLGRGLLSAVIPNDHAPDPLVVQTVLQAVMVSHTAFVCNTWTFGLDKSLNFAQDLYCSMRQTEQQSVAGRWRALCLTYMKKLIFPDDAERRLTAKDELLRCITDALLASGVAKPPYELLQEVESSYADVLREIVRLAHEFQYTTVERIISRDLLIFTVKTGTHFDPSRMVDEWADPKMAWGRVDIDLVLCTTQLGVVRAGRVASEEVGGEGDISETVLLKPKVVLAAFLEQL